MFKRTSSFIFLLTLLSLVIVGCSSTDQDKTETVTDPIENKAVATVVEPTKTDETDTAVDSVEEDPSQSEAAPKIFTLEELALYNGKNGQPAYIAVNGTVYDVTDVGVWKNGDHNGYEAGKDLTDFFPHDTSRLEYGEIVGILE